MRGEGLFEKQEIRGLGGGWWERAGLEALGTAMPPWKLSCQVTLAPVHEGWCQRWQHSFWAVAVASLAAAGPMASALGALSECAPSRSHCGQRCAEASVNPHKEERGAKGRVFLCADTGSHAWTMGSSLSQQKSPWLSSHRAALSAPRDEPSLCATPEPLILWGQPSWKGPGG